MKIGDLFLMVVGLDLLDLFSTMVALENNLGYEGNPIMAWFFSFGAVGYFYSFIFTNALCFLFFLGIYGFKRYKERKYKKEIHPEIYALVGFGLVKLVGVVNNVGTILRGII